MLGTEKSFSVERIAPRSSATTFSPASANSLLRIPPVQPRPTTTTSTSLSFVTMRVHLRSPHEAQRNAGRIFPSGAIPDYASLHPGYDSHPGCSAHVRDAERIGGK